MKNNKKIVPLVEFGSCYTSEERYIRDTEYWYTDTLIKYVKDEKLPVFEIPLSGLNLNKLPFNLYNLDDFVWQMKRTLEVDLKYPIILDDLGQIANGNHRICKALLDGKRTIKAVRIINMPKADGHDEL